jgi:tetratricopeptide (TPR) repeat protein
MFMRHRLLCFIIALIVLGPLHAAAARAQGGTTIPIQIEGESAAPDSDAIDLMIFDGEVYLEQGDYLRAVALFTKVTTYAPDRAYGHLLLGRALTTALVNNKVQDVQGAVAEAVRQYRWVLNRDPGNREAHEGLAILSKSFYQGMDVPLTTDRGRKSWAAGQRALAKGNFEAAAKAFQDAARAEPKVLDVQRALGEALRRAGKNDDAVSAFERALVIAPGDVASHGGLGQALEAEGDTAAALVHYRRAFTLDDHYRPAVEGIVRILGARERSLLSTDELALRGRAELAAGSYDAAFRDLEDATADDPILVNRKALGICQFFRKKDTEATILLTGAYQEDPTDSETLYYLAATLIRQGRIEDGQEYLRKALIQNGEDASALRLLGLTLSEQPGSEKQAIELLQRAEKLGAGMDDLPCILAPMELRLGRSEEARRDYETCLAQNPDNAQAVLGLGLIADDAGRRGEAIMHFERYLRMADPDPGVLFRLGVAYLRVGKDEDAFTTLRRITEIDTTLAPADSGRVTDRELLEMTSFFLASMRRLDDAIFVGEMLLSKDPESAVYNNNLAMSYADADQKPQRAYELAEKANRLSPDNPGYLDTLGWAQVRLKKYEDAEKTLLKSIQLAHEAGRDDLSEIYYHLGYLYRLMDRHDEATEYLTRALQKPPTPMLQSEIQRLLELEKGESGKP